MVRREMVREVTTAGRCSASRVAISVAQSRYQGLIRCNSRSVANACNRLPAVRCSCACAYSSA
jgi:hypothetical protein